MTSSRGQRRASRPKPLPATSTDMVAAMSESRASGDAHRRNGGAAAAPAAAATSAKGGSKKAAPPFCRLVTGDELGLIRGEGRTEDDAVTMYDER
eukprot:353336-Chlamydomonas_euryale.AAC.3